MPSVRIRGISAKVDEKKIMDKVKRIRKTLGPEYRIIIENSKISVEGDILDPMVRKKILSILAS